MRRRPSVPLAREAAAIDIRICIRRIDSIDIIDRPKAGGKRKSPGGNEPPGLSRFSALFYVAAIGGKSPRFIDCADTLCRIADAVKRTDPHDIAGALRFLRSLAAAVSGPPVAQAATSLGHCAGSRHFHEKQELFWKPLDARRRR
jgi:hypothetical protein